MSEAAVTVPDPIACAGFLTLAFVLAGCAHVVWLRSRMSRRFAIPVDCGWRVRGKRVFGENKMLRGFIVMIPAAGLSFGFLYLLLRTAAPELARLLWPLVPSQYFAVGLLAGSGFMLGELPNSFMKRQFGIEPGRMPLHPACRPFFFLIDHLDSIAGMLLALNLAVTVPVWTCAYVAVFGIVLHCLFSALLFAFGVKERIA